ncbi:MAG: hypothetical protein AAFP08_06565 [Bacteroidota bacterium]
MRSLFICLSFLTALGLAAQDLQNLTNRQAAQVSGSLQFGMQFYRAEGLPSRANPFQVTANGNLNIQLLEEFNIPISWAIGRQRPNIRGPVFSQFGLSPRYKSLTVHAGYRNLNFGRFTLNNHTFLGGGVEVQSGKLRLAGMYGRLRQGVREVSEDIDLFTRQPLYNRMAWGGRIGFGTDESHFDITYFRAEDRDLNLDADQLDSLDLPPPAENIVLGIDFKQRIGQNFNLFLEAAGSGFNRNLNSEELPINEAPVSSLIEPLFTARFSNQAGLAIRGGFKYRLRAFNIGAEYERIDPGFESMGTYFLNGDWENYRINSGFGLFRNRVRLQGSLGIQRNNLYEQRLETNRRVIGAGNLLWQGGDNWGLSMQYSNFSQDQRPSALIVLNDTLRIASTTENIGGSWYLSTSSSDGASGNWLVTLNLQRTDNDNPLNEGFTQINTLFSTLGYTHRFPNQKTQLSGNVNFNRIELAIQPTSSYGITLGVQHQLAEDKLRLSASNTFNRNLVNGEADGLSNVLRANMTWSLNEIHQLTAGFSWLERNSDLGFGFREQRLQIGYGMRFRPKRKSEEE